MDITSICAFKLQINIKKWLLRWSFFLTLAIFSFPTLAQDADSIEIKVNELAKIKFYNGSVFYGKILHYNPRDSLVFLNSQNKKINIPSNVVRRVEESLYIQNIKKQAIETKYRFFDKDWYIDLSAYILAPLDHEAAGLQLSAGHRFNQWLSLGGFIARDHYDPYLSEVLYPVGAELSGYFFDRGFTPFYKLNLGYGFMFKDPEVFRVESRGGLMLMPALGVRFTGYKYFNGYFIAGYRFQSARTVNTIGWRIGEERTKDIFYRRLTIGVGFVL